MTIKFRMTLWYTSILTVTLIIFGIVLYYFLNIYIYNNLKNNLSAQSERINQHLLYDLNLSQEGWSLLIQLDDYLTFNNDYYLEINNFTTGKSSRSSNLRKTNLPFSNEKLAINKYGYFQNNRIDGVALFIHNRPLYYKNKIIGVLQVAYNVNLISSFFNTLKFILLILTVIVILFAATVGWFLARKTLRPIYTLINATKQIQKSEDFNKRIIYDGPQDELGLLSGTINEMLERIRLIYSELDQSHLSQKRFVSDASHELRTPLTTISGNAEFLYKVWGNLQNRSNIIELQDSDEIKMSLESIKDIIDEARRMGSLVNDLLTLARTDSGFQINMEVLLLKDIIQDVNRKVHFFSKNIDYLCEDLIILDDVYIRGNSDYIQQLLFTFIENAFKYTQQGYVKMSFIITETEIGLLIKDTGIGMEDSQIPYIFDRFYRADDSRGSTQGTGLGLSIAKWIIDEHGGRVEVTSSLGEGSIFYIWLPVIPDLN
jgi:two-component system OmpR family sensor kinase